MTIRDYADAPFEPEAEWAGPVAKREPKKVVINDEEEQDPHHV